jgi:hypothetical protein
VHKQCYFFPKTTLSQEKRAQQTKKIQNVLQIKKNDIPLQTLSETQRETHKKSRKAQLVEHNLAPVK